MSQILQLVNYWFCFRYFWRPHDVNDVSFTNCFVDFLGSQIRFNVEITIVLRLNALLVIYILPENIGPHCNYKIIGGRGAGDPPPPPPYWWRPCTTFKNVNNIAVEVSSSYHIEEKTFIKECCTINIHSREIAFCSCNFWRFSSRFFSNRVKKLKINFSLFSNSLKE